jgi:hypothetical protein
MSSKTNINSVYPEEALSGMKPHRQPDLKGLNILSKWQLHSKSDQYIDNAENTVPHKI